MLLSHIPRVALDSGIQRPTPQSCFLFFADQPNRSTTTTVRLYLPVLGTNGAIEGGDELLDLGLVTLVGYVSSIHRLRRALSLLLQKLAVCFQPLFLDSPSFAL